VNVRFRLTLLVITALLDIALSMCRFSPSALVSILSATAESGYQDQALLVLISEVGGARARAYRVLKVSKHMGYEHLSAWLQSKIRGRLCKTLPDWSKQRSR
jgi:hypothetical protein